MKMKLITVHFAAALLGLVLIAVALLIILQWDKIATITFFGAERDLNTAWVLLATLLAGAILPKLLIWQCRWLKVIHKVRKEQTEFNRKAINAMTQAQSPKVDTDATS